MTVTTLVLGNNRTTGRIAQDLLHAGSHLILATPRDHFDFSADCQTCIESSDRKAKLFTHTTVVACRGTFGNYQLSLSQNHAQVSCRADQIILCEDFQRRCNFDLHGLTPSPFVRSLSQVMHQFRSDTGADGFGQAVRKVVFLMGLARESTPLIAGETLECALRLQHSGRQVYILTGNLKVAASGLEKRYRENRQAGVVFVKFGHTRPAFAQGPDPHTVITFEDEILSQPLRLTPDLTVVDETLEPSDYLVHLERLFQLDTDPDRFAQSDNVHRLSVLTNRKGILAAGPSRGLLSAADHRLDADNAVLRSRALQQAGTTASEAFAQIDPGNCIRCLTCYRLCPYRAIRVDARVTVQADACEGCGICIAECPRQAIRMEGSDSTDVRQAAAQLQAVTEGEPFAPSIAALCCSRSAAQAEKLAFCLGLPMPKGLKTIKVPCAGSISLQHLLALFQNSADGVLVLSCHEGNCHSEQGNRMAMERVRCLKGMMEQMGFETERLMLKTLAANMGREFAEIVAEFEKALLQLGPTRVRP